MKIVQILMLVIFAQLAGHMAASEPLPLDIEVDLSGLEGIEEYDGGEDALRETLRLVLHDHMDRRLRAFWSVTTDSVDHRLKLEVEASADDPVPYFLFSFEPYGDEAGDARGRSEIGSPAQSPNFKRAMVSALKYALRLKRGELRQTTVQIHKNWDFGLTTKIEINRPLQAADTRFYKDHQAWIIWPHAELKEPIKSRPPSPFSYEIALPPFVPRTARIRPIPHTAALGNPEETFSKLCIRRDEGSTPAGAEPVAVYDCPLKGRCTLKSVSPPGWASDLCETQGRFWPNGWEQFLVTSAFAANSGSTVWSVPPITTLYDRMNTDSGSFVGFTDFEIDAESLQGIDADSYTVEVFANDVPIWLDGLPPAENPHSFFADDGLIIRFGLENLQFSGRVNGCETLRTEVSFFRDHEPVGEPLVLERKYAAMRHANMREFDTKYGRVNWSGRYLSPTSRKETGLFVLSSHVFHYQDREEEAKVLKFLNEKRALLDNFKWTITRGELGGTIGAGSSTPDQPLRIVGKIRPPTKARANGGIAYGILAGIEQPNGQLQFSFDGEQIDALRQKLLTLRATQPAAGDVIPARKKDFYRYTYTEKRKVAPDWVCR